MSDADFADLLRDERAALAMKLAAAAASLLVPAFHHGEVQAHNKLAGLRQDGPAGFDPVTAADRAAEARLREMIAQAFPDDGIIGEEFGSANATAEWCWVLDPVDGTRAFLCGLPGWTTLIALLHEGRPRLGLICEPLSGVLLIGNNHGCWRLHGGSPRRVHTRPTTQLSQALAGTTLPRLYDTPGRQALLKALQRHTRHLQFDADAMFYAAVAAGRMDVALDTGLKQHDAAALVPVVRGAGGVISDWRGGPAGRGGDVLACATPALHRQLLHLVERCGAAGGGGGEG